METHAHENPHHRKTIYVERDNSTLFIKRANPDNRRDIESRSIRTAERSARLRHVVLVSRSLNTSALRQWPEIDVKKTDMCDPLQASSVNYTITQNNQRSSIYSRVCTSRADGAHVEGEAGNNYTETGPECACSDYWMMCALGMVNGEGGGGRSCAYWTCARVQLTKLHCYGVGPASAWRRHFILAPLSDVGGGASKRSAWVYMRKQSKQSGR
ncbi:uncharacterized protein V1518DRAFT_38244 [Limtongia smithiae]|uniref:uncharacterized protein n=1 Tax=Limtongia smithiae TaxID=1125753 RepID=UPI0034CE1CD3